MIDTTVGFVDQLLEHAVDEAPNECCGVVLTNGEVVRMRNVSPRPDRSFDMHPDDLIALYTRMSEEGLEIKATYHSHPAASADQSDTDKEQVRPGLWQIIIGQDGTIEVYQ